MLEETGDLRRYSHLEAAGSRHLSALSRWEQSDPEFVRRLAPGYYSDPEGWIEEIWREGQTRPRRAQRRCGARLCRKAS